jgi:hypothetical protein
MSAAAMLACALSISPALPAELVRSGTLRVALPPDQALELFTAEGEKRWAPGWQPRFVTPPDGTPAVGGVWLTEQDGQEVIWRVQRFDRAAREVEYLRITPGNRVVTVQVALRPDGADSRVTVTYRVIAIAEAGRRYAEAYTAESYAAMLREWERLIAAHLASGAAASS